MTTRIFIVHGWEDSPHNGWVPWLKTERTTLGHEVHALSMPSPESPQIDTGVNFLRHAVGQPDKQTIFIGHSIGGQAILRYLMAQPATVQVGGVVQVAAWVTLKAAALSDDNSIEVATPWLQRPLDWAAIKSRVNRVAAIVSDDDQFVPLADADIFKRELGAKIIIEHRKGHISGADGVTRVVSVLKECEDMINETVD